MAPLGCAETVTPDLGEVTETCSADIGGNFDKCFDFQNGPRKGEQSTVDAVVDTRSDWKGGGHQRRYW